MTKTIYNVTSVSGQGMYFMIEQFVGILDPVYTLY